jgi:hypothetical protein
MWTHRLLLAGILFTFLLIVPVAAELNNTRFADGTLLISNGSYWIRWDPVGDHDVGDRFFVNGTTNLPAGTTLYYQFSMWEYIKNAKNPGTGGNVVIEPEKSGNNNRFSIVINTTGFHPDNYMFTFCVCPIKVCPSNNRDASQAFSDPDFIVYYKISLSPAIPCVDINPLRLSLSLIPVSGALVLSLGLDYAIRKKKEQHQ